MAALGPCPLNNFTKNLTDMKLPVCVKSSIQQTPAQARRHRHTHTHLLPFQMILSPADAMPANCKTMAVGECADWYHDMRCFGVQSDRREARQIQSFC